MDGAQAETNYTVISIAICSILLLQVLLTSGSSISGFRTKQQYHLRRKAQHVSTGVMIVYTSTFISSVTVALVLAFWSCMFYLLHVARLKYPSIQRGFLHRFQSVLRPHEQFGVPSSFYFLLGSSLAYFIFPKSIAIISVLDLSFGDPCASFFGLFLSMKASWIPNWKFANKKSLLGTLACASVCTFISYCCFDLVVEEFPQLDFNNQGATGIFLVLSGLISAASEFISIYDIDDNLTMPLLTGMGKWILVILMSK